MRFVYDLYASFYYCLSSRRSDNQVFKGLNSNNWPGEASFVYHTNLAIKYAFIHNHVVFYKKNTHSFVTVTSNGEICNWEYSIRLFNMVFSAKIVGSFPPRTLVGRGKPHVVTVFHVRSMVLRISQLCRFNGVHVLLFTPPKLVWACLPRQPCDIVFFHVGVPAFRNSTVVKVVRCLPRKTVTRCAICIRVTIFFENVLLISRLFSDMIAYRKYSYRRYEKFPHTFESPAEFWEIGAKIRFRDGPYYREAIIEKFGRFLKIQVFLLSVRDWFPQNIIIGFFARIQSIVIISFYLKIIRFY